MNAWLASDGARLTFRDSGSGLPVVFLHPTPLDGDFWRPMIEEVAGIRAIVPDLRGHGQSQLGSSLPAGSFHLAPHVPVLTMAQLAADVIALLDRLEIEEAAFTGCSVGGYVMLELWRRIPQRMRALAFFSSKPQPDTDSGLVRRAANIAQIQSEGTAKFFDSAAQSLIGASARERHPEIVTELRARMTLTQEAAVAMQAGLAMRPDSMPTVLDIEVPVLAVAGGEDSAVTSAEMEAFNAAPGGCEFHLLPDAGHFAAYEQPQKLAALHVEWLRQFAA